MEHTFEEERDAIVGATILIADDVAEWRVRVREILYSQPECRIVGEACNGVEAVQKTRELRPDLVLLDIGMPLMNGLQAAVRIRGAVPTSKIVILTQEDDPELRSAAISIGAGYVLKINAASDLFSAISRALRNSHHTWTQGCFDSP